MPNCKNIAPKYHVEKITPHSGAPRVQWTSYIMQMAHFTIIGAMIKLNFGALDLVLGPRPNTSAVRFGGIYTTEPKTSLKLV